MTRENFISKFFTIKKYLTAPFFSYKTFPGILFCILLSFGIVFWFSALKTVDPVHHSLQFYDKYIYALSAGTFILAAAVFLLYRRYAFRVSPCGLLCAAGAVLCGVFPSFTSFSASLTLLAFAIWSGFDRKLEKFSENKLFWCVPAVLFVFVFASGLEQQLCAYDRLILLYSDWGIYFSGYRQLAENPGASFTQYLSIGNHFNPAVNAVMALVMFISPKVASLFAVNSFLIASIVPLTYILCRCLKLPQVICALCSVAAAFNPMLSNQHTTLTYGYHPVIFLIPVFLLFCIAKEKRSVAGMICAGIFMCGIKETVFIFASGVILLRCLKKKWFHAASAALLLGGVFFFVTHYILPRCDGGSGYFQLFQYNSLGNSVAEIVLSPLLSPAVFWGKFFRIGNLSFLLLLLLPFIPAVFYAPRYLLAAVPIVAGIMIKDCYLDQHNIVQQYGVEITAWFFASFVYGIHSAYKNGRITCGFTAALLFGVLAGFFFVGKTPVWGTYSATPVRQSPHIGILREEIKKTVPPSASAAVSSKWGAQLTESHRKLFFQLDHPDADYTILDFTDSFADMKQQMQVRDAFLLGQNAYPVRFMNLRGCQIVIFKKGKGVWNLPFIVNRSPEQLLPGASDLPLNTQDIRGRAVVSGHPQKHLLLFLAPAPGLNKDLSLRITAYHQQELRSWFIRWGYGLYPAYMMKKNHSFAVQLPLPSHWQQLSKVEIKTLSYERGK